MSNNKMTVAIAGRDYTVISAEPEEHIKKVAEYLDRKISEIAYSNNQMTVGMATVLAAINITDEYFKSLEAADLLRQQIGSYIDDVAKDRSLLSSVRAENERLKSQLGQRPNDRSNDRQDDRPLPTGTQQSLL